MTVWWQTPLLRDHEVLLPGPLLDVVARAFAVVQVGGLSGLGAERGRRFERLFFDLCDSRGVPLAERAGARTVAGQPSASGLNHEVDGATKSPTCTTHWELKHLSCEVPKNDLLVFNSKGIDFLQGSTALIATMPMKRFLLTGTTVRPDCRRYAVLWGIAVIEPDRLPLPLIYEAVARGACDALTPVERHAILTMTPWGARPLQSALRDAHAWGAGKPGAVGGAVLQRRISEALDVQEQLGARVLDLLEDASPDWIDLAAEETWTAVGGW